MFRYALQGTGTWKLYRYPELCGGKTGRDPAYPEGLSEPVGEREKALRGDLFFSGGGQCRKGACRNAKVPEGGVPDHRGAACKGNRAVSGLSAGGKFRAA